MRILGIDPGTAIVGYAIVDYENGKYNNIWVSFPSHNRPNITIGDNYEISEACDSLEEAVLKVITEARKDK